MKIGSIVAFESDPAQLGEVIETFIFPATGELGLKIKPFDNSCSFYLHASEVWLLADNL
jgi:hypothetical protein